MSEIDPLIRFEQYICPEPNSGCWLWTAADDGRGYGLFWFQGALIKAHRFSYQSYVGEIPDGFVLDHLCRVRSCVNPAHLEVVTQSENCKRGNTGIMLPTVQAARRRAGVWS